MICPHCRVSFFDKPSLYRLGADADGPWEVLWRKCPSCLRYIVWLVNGELSPRQSVSTNAEIIETLEAHKFQIWPKGSSRPPCPLEVPERIAKVYTAACLILEDSPEASAAMSRKCLQSILRDPVAGNVKGKTLYDEIEQVINSGQIPQYVSQGLHTIRHYGNFGAHPVEDQVTGEIIPVEPGEAEYTLTLLETLFEFYYVAPAVFVAKQAQLNAKLQATKGSK